MDIMEDENRPMAVFYEYPASFRVHRFECLRKWLIFKQAAVSQKQTQSSGRRRI